MVLNDNKIINTRRTKIRKAALAIILLTPGEVDTMQDESATPVELSDEVKVASEDSKSYDVVISEGLDVGDGNP